MDSPSSSDPGGLVEPDYGARRNSIMAVLTASDRLDADLQGGFDWGYS
ncbi:hypothetical protein SBBP2_660003 [Burkholderiales bacterium]|nr:hypothetical protein SBBP2_660003 [Burkholderiales bacterium]